MTSQPRSTSSQPSPAHVSAHRRNDRACILVLFALTLSVYAPALFGGKVLLPADIIPLMRPWAMTAREKFPEYRFAQNQMHGPIFEYYSWRRYARERILAGEVPLWNPYEMGGNVLLANSQSAVLYPPNLLLYLFPLPVGINLVTALHTFLTGCFMFWLLRRRKLGAPAALTGALVWMFCGLQVVWTEFQTPTAVLCWLPAALLAWELFIQEGDWRWTVFGSGSVVAMILLAGHLQFAFYSILAFVLYALWRREDGRTEDGSRKSEVGSRKTEDGSRKSEAGSRKMEDGSRKMEDGSRQPESRSSATSAAHRLIASSPHRFILLLGALVFGIALSSATMVPVVEMARMNFRGAQDNYAGSIGLRLPPKNILTLILPNLYGNPRDYVSFDSNGQPSGGNPYFGAFDFIEYTAYLGIPALLLASLGVWRLARRNGNHACMFFAVLVLLGLLLALGTPLCALFFYGVPGYRQFNATARALCLFSFGIAALSSYGVQAISDTLHAGNGKRIGTAAAWIGGVILLLGLIAFPGMALVETVKDPTGKEVARLLTDQWFGYELAGLLYFALFLALTGFAAWLALRKSGHRFIWALPAVAVADLLTWGAGFNPITQPGMLGYPTQTTDILKDKSPDRVVSLEAPGKGIKSFIVPNYNAVVHLRDVQGADSLHTKRYHKLLEGVVLASEPGRTSAFADPNTLHVPNVNHPFFNLMNVRFVTTDPEIQLGSPFRKMQDAELTIWENPNAFGPAWLVGHMIEVRDSKSALSMIGDPGFDLRGAAVLDRPAKFASGYAVGTAQIASFSPHRIAYDVTSSGNGLLVTSEIFFPGWRAAVDGPPSEVVNADWILRATPITPGKHRVVFSYEPASYRVGLYLTALCAGLFAGFLVCKRRPESPTLRVPQVSGTF